MKTTYPQWLIKFNKGTAQVLILFTIPFVIAAFWRADQLKRHQRIIRPRYADSLYQSLILNSYLRDKYIIKQKLT